VDQDYNFLHGIESKIERSEKEIVEERGLVRRAELKAARRGGEEQRRGRRRLGDSGKNWNLAPGEQQIDKCLRLMGIRVIRAPKGMDRRTENTTNWSKNQGSINWQVEWFQEGGEGRVMAKCMGNQPLGECWDQVCEVVRRGEMGSEEKKLLKKRKAEELKGREREVKKARRDERKTLELPIIATTCLQDPETGSWNINLSNPTNNSILHQFDPPEPSLAPAQSTKSFYLLRVQTPSTLPKILIPLDPSLSLSDQLRRRAVLEYPTIYVFGKDTPISEGFMLEKDFLVETGQESLEESEDDSESSEDNSESSEGESGDSSSEGSTSEEGEISD
jgi:hypothetical protein